MIDTLGRLQEHCRLAIWSSTTSRNTNPLIEAVFRDPNVFQLDESASSQNQKGKALQKPLQFEFVWCREHTTVDEFRRSAATVREEEHATLKDLTNVFRQYPSIANPINTVLIDDTPSKARTHADNYLWLDSCEGDGLRDPVGMKRLEEFVMNELVKAKDVRDLLPHRIRRD